MEIGERFPERVTRLVEAPPPDTVTGYSLAGPASGNVAVASTAFTVALLPVGGTLTGSVTITPGDSGAGGAFTPATVNLTAAAPSATFTYTPSTAGTKTVSCANNRGLTNPSNLTYTASATSGLADGDPVSLWEDSSGAGHAATQSGSARPIFKTNVINGKPVVRFASAAAQLLNVASPIASGGGGYTIFVVQQANTGKQLWNLTNGVWASGGMGLFLHDNGNLYQSNSVYGQFYSAARTDAGLFHVYTSRVGGGENALSMDGTNVPIAYAGGCDTSPYSNIGSTASDGDIAEIIIYSAAVGLRAKAILLLTALLSTAEMPLEDELEEMAGNRAKIKRYLHSHGAHPTNEQLDAVVEPFAVGDRANIEKYLGTKYGITVAGGTAVDPSTVAGLAGWWKADSLNDPQLPVLTGIKGWWKADSLSKADGTAVVPWPDSSGNGNNTTIVAGNPLFYNNVINGKPVVRFAGNAFGLTTPFVVTSGWTIFAVMRAPPGSTELCCLGDNGAQGNAGPLSNGTYWYIGHGGAWSNDGGVDNNWHVFNATSAPSLYIDGVLRSLNTGGSAAVGTMGYIGLRNVGLFSTGDIAEIIAYQGVLSLTDRQAVEQYLQTKYGIVTPPLEPPQQIAGLMTWLHGEGLLTYADGAAINPWTDSSGNANNFPWNGVVPGAPVCKTNILNGQRVARFNGVNTGLYSPTLPIISGNYTIFTVARAAALAATPGDMFSSGTYNAYSIEIGATSSYLRHSQSNGGSIADEAAGMVVGEWNIITGDWNGSNIHLWRNGALKATTGATVLSNANMSHGLGFSYAMKDAGQPNHFNGDIACLLIYNHALSDAERQTIHSYLGTKYGIAVSPSLLLKADVIREVKERVGKEPEAKAKKPKGKTDSLL